MNRRTFLKHTSTLTAGAFFLTISENNIFASVINRENKVQKIPYVTLNNKVKMPCLGFGTLYLTGEKGVQCISDAIQAGYRLIDTARIYGNEEVVGMGVKQSGVERSKLFITSKLWVDDAGYESTKKAFEDTLIKLGTHYLDLYLIHRPRGDVRGSWTAMEELCRVGKIRAIGISNFEPEQIKELHSYASIQPAVNQIETHVFYQESIQYDYLKKQKIVMEAWSPFAQGRNGLFENATLNAIAVKHKKTVAQICLRWHFQRGVVAIPRTSQRLHMQENIQIFDFKLDEDDLKAIATLDLDKTQFPEWT